MNKFDTLNRRIIACAACPRLIEHCRQVARNKRAVFSDCEYWGRPVPNFGDPNAALLIVGLAPGAHGANRTGRMFTGDRSGDWLYDALYRNGFASQPTSHSTDDGQSVHNCAITAACHCAPPDNKPTVGELAACSGWLRQTFDLVPARVYLALGQIAWRAVLAECRRRDWLIGSAPRFVHGAEFPLRERRCVVASYHPSQQNTFTGRLTRTAWLRVFRRVRNLLQS